LYLNELNPLGINEALDAFWRQYGNLTPDIKLFAEGLVRGTLSHLEEIDAVISRYAENWQLNRMAIIDRNILRFAAYELLYCEDIPPKVAINEAVNIAKKYSQEDAGKFVNGILDKINHTEKAREIPGGETA